jgi:hypothetical protein
MPATVTKEIDTGLSIYEINKNLMKEEKPLDPITINIAIKKAADGVLSSFKKYWMLLCRERNDYTVFIITGSNKLEDELKETILNRGKLLDISQQEDGNFEVWIRDPETEENFVYYLFDYTFGIIEV